MADINIPINSGSSIDDHISIAGANVEGLIRSSDITNILNKPSYDGKLDMKGELRLKLAIVDNPTIRRTNEARIDPIDPYDVINMTTGYISVRWVEQDGGIIRPKEFGSYGMDGETSDRESIRLTHPMMWANEINWCGINYMSPVGSVAIFGFRKHNMPVLLGFLQSHYQIMQTLELGEIMNKGYGNNTSHWKMHDEQEHKAWVIEGQSRPVQLLNLPGRKYKWDPATHTVKLKFRIKAWIDPKNPADKKEMLEMEALRIKGGILIEKTLFEVFPEVARTTSERPLALQKTTVEIRPESISQTVEQAGIASTFNMKFDSITLQAKDVIISEL